MKSKISRLEYSKIILEKVSFSQGLMLKEFQKAIGLLPEHEVEELQVWFQTNFSTSLRSNGKFNECP